MRALCLAVTLGLLSGCYHTYDSTPTAPGSRTTGVIARPGGSGIGGIVSNGGGGGGGGTTGAASPTPVPTSPISASPAALGQVGADTTGTTGATTGSGTSGASSGSTTAGTLISEPGGIIIATPTPTF